jgi:hypothetical protein
MELDDVVDDGAPVIASLPMGGGAVRGPGAGKLCVRWGLGNELRIVRARGPADAAGADADDPGTSQGAAYVVQWYVRQNHPSPGPASAPPRPHDARASVPTRDLTQP